MSKLAEKVKSAAAPVSKAAILKASLIAATPPAAQVGRSSGSGVIPLQKAMALAGGFLDAADDADAREAVDLSNRIKSVYGAFYDFSNSPRSLIVPASRGFLPTVATNGAPIHGAAEVVKEMQQRVLSVKSLDLDEVKAKAAAGDALAVKALSTLSDTAGGSLVAPPTLGDLIDLQRNLEVFAKAGGTSVTLPPNGMMNYPKLQGGATAYWVGETASITESTETTGTLELKVKKLAVRVPLTNELIRFADPNVDGMVRVDMAKQAALKADLAMLQGTGGTQPKGLITYASQSSWSQGNDKLLAYTVTSNLIQPEDVTKIPAKLPDNVEPTAWVFHPDLFAALGTRRADAVSAADAKGPFLFSQMLSATSGERAQKTLAGLPVVTSRQVSVTRGSGSQTYVLCGYFPDWLIGRLGVLEFMVDPYTNMQTYQTNIQCVQFLDAGARHPASFAFADAINVA